MTLALIVAGVVMALVAAGLFGSSGILMETVGDKAGSNQADVGFVFLFAACTCFFIAGRMTGV